MPLSGMLYGTNDLSNDSLTNRPVDVNATLALFDSLLGQEIHVGLGGQLLYNFTDVTIVMCNLKNCQCYGGIIAASTVRVLVTQNSDWGGWFGIYEV